MHPNRRWRTSVLYFLACGVWLIGLGAYFVLLRPPLLPEDTRYIGGSAAQIRAALPGLERWLDHVFLVMGGFMAGVGMLTVHLAVTGVAARRRGTGVVLVLAGLATVVTMSWTNFAITASFRWLLLAPAVLWSIGVAAYAGERRA